MLWIANWSFPGYALSWFLKQLLAIWLPSASGSPPSLHFTQSCGIFTAMAGTAQLPVALLHFQHLFRTSVCSSPNPHPELPIIPAGSSLGIAFSISLLAQTGGLTLPTQRRNASASESCLFHSGNLSGWKSKEEMQRWRGEIWREQNFKELQKAHGKKVGPEEGISRGRTKLRSE